MVPLHLPPQQMEVLCRRRWEGDMHIDIPSLLMRTVPIVRQLRGDVRQDQ